MRMLRYIIIAIAAITIISCSDDSTDQSRKEVLEIYSIILQKDTVGIGNLTYKDIKYFDNDNVLIQQEFYDKENKLKGTEYINRAAKEKRSKYYSADSTLLSYYDLVYEYDVLMLKSAFDGGTDQFLRAEQYKYDENGNRKEKMILDENGQISRVYKFVYDEYGNESGFSGFDENGEIFLLETYKITEKDKKNRWTEKWGYRDNVPYTFYKRKIID